MMTDLLGGQITLAVDSLASALPQLKAGKIRAIAMTSALRERIIERGAIPDPRGPKEFAEFVAAEIVKWSEIVRRAKLKVD